MSKKGALYIGLGFLLWLFTIQSVSAISFWNVNVDDTLQWTVRDKYYMINGYETVAEIQNQTYISSDSLYIMDYQTIKDWSTGYLDCIVATNNDTINHIRIAIEYDGLAGSMSYNRTFVIDPAFALESFVPWKIDPSEENATIFDYVIGGIGYFDASEIPVFDAEDSDIPQFLRFQFMGTATITWLDGDIEAHKFTYTFHYVNPYISEENRELYNSYENVGMKLDIVKKEDFDQDYDVVDDLVIMNTNYVRINDYYLENPNYIDASAIFTILNAILNAVRDSNPDNDIPDFLNFGFSLPSGMYTIYSDTASTIQALIMNSDIITRNLLIPLILNKDPEQDDIIAVLDALGENDVKPIRIFNLLGILSFANLLILPTGTDFSKMNDIVFEISEMFADLDPSEYIGLLGVNDSTNMQYLFSNMLESSNAQNTFSLGINPNIIPTVFDSRNGQTQIAFHINWDTKNFLLKDLVLEVNHPQNGYGHQLSLSYVYPEVQGGWIQNILGGITMLFSLLGLGFVVRKVVIKKRSHFTMNTDLKL